MTDARDLARYYRRVVYDDGRIGTHWATCDEGAHPVCALLRLCDAVLADADENARLRAALEQCARGNSSPRVKAIVRGALGGGE